MNISPKVLLPALLSLLAAVALYLLTGDDTYLVMILLSLVGGGIGIAAPPAPGVSQAEVTRLAAKKRKPTPVPPPQGP